MRGCCSLVAASYALAQPNGSGNAAICASVNSCIGEADATRDMYVIFATQNSAHCRAKPSPNLETEKLAD